MTISDDEREAQLRATTNQCPSLSPEDESFLLRRLDEARAENRRLKAPVTVLEERIGALRAEIARLTEDTAAQILAMSDDQVMAAVVLEYKSAEAAVQGTHNTKIIALNTIIDSQKSEIARLKELLLPFSQIGGGADMQAYHDLDDDVVVYREGAYAITAGDIRKAREALGPTSAMHFRKEHEVIVADAMDRAHDALDEASMHRQPQVAAAIQQMYDEARDELRTEIARLKSPPGADAMITARLALTEGEVAFQASIGSEIRRINPEAWGHLQNAVARAIEQVEQVEARGRAQGIEEAAQWHERQATSYCKYAERYPDLDGHRAIEKAEQHTRSANDLRALADAPSQPQFGSAEHAQLHQYAAAPPRPPKPGENGNYGYPPAAGYDGPDWPANKESAPDLTRPG